MEEIKRGATIFSGEQYLGENATVDNFYKYSELADIIHLSLHGLVDEDDPGRSCIIFDDRKENFVLSALDLYSHKINADLVILSACHTASGRIYSGEGVQGMSKAFLLSGARNILSSLWSASEVSSLEIMTSFLKNVRVDKSKDLALHKAKLAYLATVEPNLRHPFYWSNFILLGELEPKRSALNAFSIVLIILASALFLLFFLRFRKKSPH